MALAVHCLTLLMCILAGAGSQVSNHSASYDHEMHKRDNEDQTAWQHIIGTAMKHVSIGQAGVWAVGERGKNYYRLDSYHNEASSGEDWITVEGVPLEQLDVGRTTVWGVQSNNQAYYRDGISIADRAGTTWVPVPGGTLSHVSVSQKDHVWGVKPNEDVYHRIGATIGNPGGNSWRRITGQQLKQISVGVGGVWGVAGNHQLYYRVGTFGDRNVDPDGSSWVQVPGINFMYVSSAQDVYTIKNTNEIYFRYSRSASNPTGDRWGKISGNDMKQVESLSSKVWCINYSGEVYRKDSD